MTTKIERKPYLIRHEDDKWVDEIRLVTVPRWKESELSGDEWRFSVTLQAFRKGYLIAERFGGHDVEQAAAGLTAALDSFGGTQSGSGWEETPTNRNKELWDSLCAQPMCAEFATVELHRLHHYCAEGHTHDAEWRIEHIRFCDRHKRRGDCGLNDADRNYSVAALRLPDGSWRPVEATPSESTEG